MNDAGEATRRWRAYTLICIGALAALIFAWQLWPAPTWNGIVRAALLCVPLALPLPGLVRRNRYTYRWATLCVMPYFIVGVTEAIANPATRLWAAALLLLALGMFAALLGFLRAGRAAADIQ